MTAHRVRCFAALLVATSPGVLAAQQTAAPPWLRFQSDTLRIAFRYPPTPGLSTEVRPAACGSSDGVWGGGTRDSTLLVTRTVAPFDQIAANLGLERDGDGWVAAGYQGTRSPVALVRAGAWEALVTRDAETVVYDTALRGPVPARQWRFLAMGPAADGCRPLLLAIVTGNFAAWDSAAVSTVLAGARPRAP